MKKFRFYGYSDDLVRVDGPSPDEYSADHAIFLLTSPSGGGVRIEVGYDGVWAITTAPIEEEGRVPASWRFWLFQGNGDPVPVYSMALIVEVDDDARLKRVEI
jgi:hypothetical protein